MFKPICILIVLLNTSTVWAGGVSPRVAKVTTDEVIRFFSQGWDDERFEMSPNDVWALKLESNKPAECRYLVSGLVKKPSHWGRSTYRFWVCIRKLGRQPSAEVIDHEQIADE